MNNRNLEYDPPHAEMVSAALKALERDPELVAAARTALAKGAKAGHDVTDILDGKWDGTPAFRKAYGELWQNDEQEKAARVAHIDDLMTGAHMAAIDRIIFLRVKMEEAVMKLRVGYPRDALVILQKALEESDVGKMKEWRAGEEPF